MKRVISLVLALVMLLSIPISAAEPTAATAAGEAMTNLAFSDDFNTGTEYDATKWLKHTNETAKITIENQKMQIGNTNVAGKYACTIASVRDLQFGDAIYEFEISNVKPSWGGLLVNRSDITHKWDNSGYFLTIDPAGKCDLQIYKNRKYVVLGTASIAGYDNTSGATMKLVQESGLVTLLANGIKLFEVSLPQDAPQSGYVGFTTGGKGNSAVLDNIKIYTKPVNNVTVTFDPLEGTCDPTVKTVQSNAAVGELPIAVKAGTYFEGWFLEQTFQTPFTQSSRIDSGVTVYAKYVEASDTLNLARFGGCNYTATSSWDNNFVPAKAFDGDCIDNLSRWAGKTAADQWIQVEFPQRLTFNRVDIYDHKSQTNGAYQLEYSADGINWNTILTGTKLRMPSQKMMFESVEAKFLRLHLTGNKSGPSIQEIEVYNILNDQSDRYPESMKVISLPDKVTYSLGEELNLSGGIVEVLFNDGMGKLMPLNSSDFAVGGFDPTVHARQTVRVEYMAAACNFEVLVMDPNAVGIVTANKPSGSYGTETISIELSCPTEGAKIYYTLDGTEPSEQSLLYVEPITLSKATTIRAIAYLEGKTPSVIEKFQYVLSRIEQYQAPFVLHPEDTIDNLECLTAGSAARNKEISQYRPEGPVKYFWIGDFGAREKDYLKWEVQSDLEQAAGYYGWLSIDAPRNSKFKLVVRQGEMQKEYPFTKPNNGWEVIDCGVFEIPSGTSTITLSSVSVQSCKVKTLNIIRESDREAYNKRIAEFRAASENTLDRFRSAPYGVFYQLGNWGFPSKGPRKGDINERANRFDAESFVALQKHMGASFVVWSTTWWTYEPWQDVESVNQILGHAGRTAGRNLINEVAAECKKQGMDFYLYYHAGVHGMENPDWELINAFPKNHNLYGAGDKSVFENNWVQVITEIGESLGTNLDGWFFDDGCNYFPANFEKLTTATRVGNPARLVSFNEWQGPKITEFQNAIFGEGSWGNPSAPMENGIFTSGKGEGLLQVAMHTLENDWGIHVKNQKPIFKTNSSDLIARTKANDPAKIASMWGITMYEDGIINPNVYNAMMALKAAIYPEIVEPATYAVTGLELVANPAGAGNQVANYAMPADGTLQMYATVRPQYATNKAVTWSVLGENGGETTLATVSESGLLTAGAANGRFLVKAISKDNAEVVAQELITITGGTEATYAATPAFSLESGRVTEEKTVSITCATEGAEIHYTLDGNRPTKDSPVYAAPLTINQTMRLKAVAIADGKYNSETAVTSYVWSGTSTGSHTHSWTYVADGATITATCGNADGNHGTPATATLTVVKPAHTTYGDSKNAAATITGSIDGVSNPAIEYYNGSTKLDAAPTDAGTYQARITVDTDKTAYVEYTIAPAAASVSTAPEAKTLTYDGSAQVLVTAGTASGGTMQYSLTGTDGTWSAAIPEGTTAGGYTVYYKVVGDTNHSDTVAAGPVNVTIAKKSVTAPVISAKSYTGEILTAEVAAPTEYTVTTNDGGTDAGDYNVVLTLSDAANYKWSDSDAATKTLTFTIAKAPLTITADNKSIKVGDPEPAYTATTTGLVNGETIGDVTFTDTATDTNTKGSFTITPADGTVSGGNANYEIVYATGTLTINIDVTVIDTAIAAANVAKTGVTVNEGEPSAVASGTKFVKQTVLDALNSAIQIATDAKLTVDTTQQASDAATALDNAVVTFTAAIKTGTYVEPSGNYPPPRPIKPEIAEPKTDTETGNTNVVITVKPETKGDTSTATVSDKTVTDALGSAVKEAEKTGGTSSVEIEITAPEGAKTVETTLSGKSLAAVAEGKTQGLKISTPVAELSFDSQALKNIAEMAGKDVKISAAEVETKSLTQAQQSQVGNAPIFDFTITSGGDTISNFNGGTATVSVPYTLKDGENPAFITVWLLDDAGKLIPIEAQYADGQITFTTGHFSRYAIGYLPFSDVKADWAYESIVYAYNNHLFGGVGDNQFAPADNMSRAMVWTVLYRLAGNPAKTDAALWYADAQAWTVAENISDGTKPNGEVTREQLATILYRYAKGTPVVVDMTKFADAAEIADYAEDAVAWAVANNILQGNAGNLNPQGDATRAQVAAMLQRFAVRNK